MKRITSAGTTCGKTLKPGTRLNVWLRGKRGPDSRIMGTIKSMAMSDFMSTLRVELDSGERVYLTPQYSFDPPGLQVRLSDLGYTVILIDQLDPPHIDWRVKTQAPTRVPPPAPRQATLPYED